MGHALTIEEGPGAPRDVVTITITGDLDIVTAPALAEQFDAVIGSGHRRVRVDLRAVHFCDVAGLNVLVAAHDRLDALGGNLTMYGPCPAVRILLDALGTGVALRLVRRPRG